MQKPMRYVWQSLLWKEWHEQKWKLLGFILLVLLGFLLLGEDFFAMPSRGIQAIVLIYSILVGLFVGMQVASRENGRGTMAFLRTLPVSMRKPAFSKFFVAWLTAILPIVLFIGFAYGYLRWQGMSYGASFGGMSVRWVQLLLGSVTAESWATAQCLVGAAIVSSVLLWTAATGVNRSDEIRAGAVSFLIMAAVWFVLMGVLAIAGRYDLTSLEKTMETLLFSAPAGPAAIIDIPIQSWGQGIAALVLSVVIHSCLLTWFLFRFGRKSNRPARTLGGQAAESSSPLVMDWLAAPRRSQLTALIWKQLYETGPLALMAGTAVLTITGLIVWFESTLETRNTPGQTLAAITISAGFLVTLVAGMGVFLEDVKPGISQFWRSRPVNVTQWFFVKYLTGAMVLAITFGSLTLLAFVLPSKRGALVSDVPEELAWTVALFIIAFLLLYTISMMSYCLTRQPVMAVIATVGTLFCGSYVFEQVTEYLIDILGWQPKEQMWIIMVALVFVQLAATAITWLTVRNNWGWQR